MLYEAIMNPNAYISYDNKVSTYEFINSLFKIAFTSNIFYYSLLIMKTSSSSQSVSESEIEVFILSY